MSTNASEALIHAQPGRRFFERSALRSVSFCIVSALLILTVVTQVFIMIKYWKRLPPGLPLLLALFGCGGVTASWWRSLSWHGRLHELHLVGKLNENQSEHTLDSALNAAASAMLDCQFFTFASIFILSVVVAYFLGRIPN